MNRKAARIKAMEIIFQIDALNDWANPDIKGYIVKSIGILAKNDQEKYIESLVTSIVEHKAEIDEKISTTSKHYRIDRIAKADLAILRIAMGEILFVEDVPNGVAIFEAGEMAKTYGGDQSPAFINAILRNATN